MSFPATGMKRKYADASDNNGVDSRSQIRVNHSNTLQTQYDLDSHRYDHNVSGDDSRQISSVTSELSSRNSPLPTHASLTRKFDRNASIVLIGMSGTGKSSLAVILSKATGRQLIDNERFFHQATGQSRQSFKTAHGTPAYKRKERDVMMSLLKSHETNCVITCGPGSVERDIQILLSEYSKSHPVIHVVRDAQSIQNYVKSWDLDRVHKLLAVSGLLYRSCSNLEFFNVSETDIGGARGESGTAFHAAKYHRTLAEKVKSPFLTLKRVERDFLQFVAFATGDTLKLSKLNSSFPLSLVPIELRQYTYAVSVSITSLLEHDLDIEAIASTADAFELRVDINDEPSTHLGLAPQIAHRISETVAVIRRNIIVPIIYHVLANIKPQRSSTKSYRRSDYEYLNLVEHGLRLAPDFLTVDLSFDDAVLSKIVSMKGYTKIIGHFTPLEPELPAKSWRDDIYQRMHHRAKLLGVDMIRLSQKATRIEDNFDVQEFRRGLERTSLRTIAFNTGALGRLSCLFNPLLTPVTHGSIPTEWRSVDDPKLSLAEAQAALFSSFTLDPMRYYLFGANVAYSLSPAMHNAAYEACGLPHRYQTFYAPSLNMLDELIRDPNFGGSSVSLPYKAEIIPLLHSMSSHACAIGAVNTLMPIRDALGDPLVPLSVALFQDKNRAGPVKALYGDNTDWIGIHRCIRRGLSPANMIRDTTTGLVVGAGGMARAAVYSMIHLGVRNIFLLNRTLSNAEKLAEHYNQQNNLQYNDGKMTPLQGTTVHVIRSRNDHWPKEFKHPTMIVSCVPAHQIGDVPSPDFTVPPQWLESPTGGVVVDLAYKPLITPLIKQIRSLAHQGWVALDGLDVLPEQGIAQFELLTGRRAPRKVMREVVLREYKGEDVQIDPKMIPSRLERVDGQVA